MTTASGRAEEPAARALPRLETSDSRRTVRRQILLAVVGSQAQAWFLIIVARLLADRLAGRGLSGGLVSLAAFLVFVAGMSAAASSVVGSRSAPASEAGLHRRVLQHAFDLGPAMFTGRQTGAMTGMLTDQTERVAGYRQTFIGPMIGSVVSPMLILISVAIAIDPIAAVILLAAVPFIPLAVGGFQRAFRKVSASSREARGKLASQFLEAIQGLTTLKGLRAADRVGDALAHTGEQNRRATMALLARNQLILLVTDAAFSLFMLTAAGLLAWWRLRSGAMDAGQALGLVLVSALLCAPMEQIGSFFYIGMAGKAAQRQIQAFLGRETPVQCEATSSGSASAIEMRGASFGYSPDRPVLIDFDLSVEPHSTTVILGPSGSGKSTLMSVLAGDLLPSAGVTQIGGVALTAATRDQVRQASAMVRQRSWLFYGTLAENLRIGNPQARDDELWQALDDVALADWASRLPDGLGTQLGEQGLAVSGGQAQRIALARAIVSGRDLLLLDEPTSQVDQESERIILGAIDALARDHTIVMVSHRLSAISHADQVVEVAVRADEPLSAAATPESHGAVLSPAQRTPAPPHNPSFRPDAAASSPPPNPSRQPSADEQDHAND
ncbi:ATP-binding cassette domain-containing protein [Propionimicrobium sp. PCR01-08-3]|uniref:ATP-binding cassette domain-containing protein n=1 Tax=Propionimicrobium sp. PCR01-08-3 TaxID=3052086 RepID=UPI00255C7CF2|nr:ATP-binding cassette domain-containing protein [Propionimicrobium sp. PCR01-08-3]WIY81584.1 ATP-binding cassette domain-containing protein [Propionimicrobium sp. PCR01-08-3]